MGAGTEVAGGGIRCPASAAWSRWISERRCLWCCCYADGVMRACACAREGECSATPGSRRTYQASKQSSPPGYNPRRTSPGCSSLPPTAAAAAPLRASPGCAPPASAASPSPSSAARAGVALLLTGCSQGALGRHCSLRAASSTGRGGAGGRLPGPPASPTPAAAATVRDRHLAIQPRACCRSREEGRSSAKARSARGKARGALPLWDVHRCQRTCSAAETCCRAAARGRKTRHAPRRLLPLLVGRCPAAHAGPAPFSLQPLLLTLVSVTASSTTF